MKIVMFYPSLLAEYDDNACFMRGIITELISRGHEIDIYEPEYDAGFHLSVKEKMSGDALSKYPHLKTNLYLCTAGNIRSYTEKADLVIVDHRSSRDLIETVGQLKKHCGYKLLLYGSDLQHAFKSSKSDRSNLSDYDGLLASALEIKDKYLDKGWKQQSWAWYEAADTRMFYPRVKNIEGDVVWMGYGQKIDADALFEFFINPVKELGLKAKVYGTNFPAHILTALSEAGIEYGDVYQSFQIPMIFSQYKFTVHIPEKTDSSSFRGVSSSRLFQSLSCGIPVISCDFKDNNHLFKPGVDYIAARNGNEMRQQISALLSLKYFREELSKNALRTINQGHTCYHRVNELEKISALIGVNKSKVYPDQKLRVVG